ncbi:MAG: hypothetical protein V3U46_03765 [Acidimicrobiia bacterium]
MAASLSNTVGGSGPWDWLMVVHNTVPVFGLIAPPLHHLMPGR